MWAWCHLNLDKEMSHPLTYSGQFWLALTKAASAREVASGLAAAVPTLWSLVVCADRVRIVVLAGMTAFKKLVANTFACFLGVKNSSRLQVSPAFQTV